MEGKVLPSLNPSPLGRDFSPRNPPRWGGYLGEILRVTCLSSSIGSPTPTPPSRAGYLGAIPLRDIFELNREELRYSEVLVFTVERRRSLIAASSGLLNVFAMSKKTKQKVSTPTRPVIIPPVAQAIRWF